MAFGTAFIFDPPTSQAIRQMWRDLETAGLPSYMLSVDYPPHITLLMGEGADLAGLHASLERLAQRTRPVPMTFDSLGVFRAQYGVVFLAPCVHQGLLDLHLAFWQAAEPYVTAPGAQYHPGVWIPHITLAYQLKAGELGPVTEFLAGRDFPAAGQVTGVEFGEYHPDGSCDLTTLRFGGA